MAGYPAASPYVLSVGGTMGAPDAQGLWNNGHYGGEQAWNEAVPFDPGFGAGGGAPSAVYKAPLWQLGMTGSPMRAVPDVSYNAAYNGGVVVVFGGRHGVLGGTSAGAPQWAAIVALANEVPRQARRALARSRDASALAAGARQEQLPQGLPRHRLRFEWARVPGSGLPGFDARPGYDFATGLGTPDVSRLLKDLSGHDSFRFRADDVDGSQHGGWQARQEARSLRHRRLRANGELGRERVSVHTRAHEIGSWVAGLRTPAR